jgi:hypothetical protein
MLGVSSRRRYCCCRCPARSRDRRRWSAELASGSPHDSGNDGILEVGLKPEFLQKFSHSFTLFTTQPLRSWLKADWHRENLASERATRGARRERVGAGGRTAGEVSTHIHLHVRHRTRVPAAEGLIEGFLASLNLASERASDARSERGRERVGAGARTAGEVSTHM